MVKETGDSLFKGGGIYWRLYKGTLAPAPAFPCFVELNEYEAKAFLKECGAWFIRYASEPYVSYVPATHRGLI